jgi:hypothetical protein
LNEALFPMDARVISAFTRVFDALLPAHDESRTTAAGISLCPYRAIRMASARISPTSGLFGTTLCLVRRQPSI